MKAIVYTEYEPPEVLQLQEVEKTIPKEHDALIRIHAASVSYGDIAARNFKGISSREFNMLLPFWVFLLPFFTPMQDGTGLYRVYRDYSGKAQCQSVYQQRPRSDAAAVRELSLPRVNGSKMNWIPPTGRRYARPQVTKSQ